MTDLMVIPALEETNKAAVADFVELECLRRHDRNVSVDDVTRMVLRGTDSWSDKTETVQK